MSAILVLVTSGFSKPAELYSMLMLIWALGYHVNAFV